jgi:peroxiredoxin
MAQPKTAPSYLVDIRVLTAVGVCVATGLLLATLFVWMVKPASAREIQAACKGLQPTLSNPALCPDGDRRCTLPQPAPDFTVTSHDGKSVRLSDFRGKVVLLNFWASWCETCKTEKPSLAGMSRRLGGDDYAVLTLASDTDWAKVLLSLAVAHQPAAVPERFTRKAPESRAIPTLDEALAAYAQALPGGLPYAVYLDPPADDDAKVGAIGTAWGMTGVPESFLIDKQGRIRYYFVSKRDWTSSVADTCLQALIDE